MVQDMFNRRDQREEGRAIFKEEMAEEFSKIERQKFLVSRTITNPKRDKKIHNIHIVFDVLQFQEKKNILKVARVKEIIYQGMTIILTANFLSTMKLKDSGLYIKSPTISTTIEMHA